MTTRRDAPTTQAVARQKAARVVPKPRSEPPITRLPVLSTPIAVLSAMLERPAKSAAPTQPVPDTTRIPARAAALATKEALLELVRQQATSRRTEATSHQGAPASAIGPHPAQARHKQRDLPCFVNAKECG